jgi:MerR family copper efflux transcriptional regulator
MEPPVACSLEPANARSQVDEWRSLLGAVVSTVEWTDPTSLRMGIRGQGDSVAALLALARREVACCPFFRFALEIDSRGLGLVVSVPADAVPILQDFAQLAPR